jgi:threonine/homoserine/homoserine lactone efflux protein
MSFVMDLINNDQNRFYLQIAGSLMLLAFGFYTYRSDPTRKMHLSGQQKGTLWYNTWTAFLVTFSNPLIIFLFMGCFAQFAFVVPDHPVEMCLGYLSIVFGALLWWYGLTWLIDKVRTIFDTTGIIIINKVIGSIVIIFSLIVLFGTMFNLYTLPEF